MSEEEDDDETQDEELDLEVLSMMTAQVVMAFSQGETGQGWMEDQRPGAWCRGTKGSPAGRQRDWPSARGSSGAYENCQMWGARTQGSRLPGAQARSRGKAMFQLR